MTMSLEDKINRAEPPADPIAAKLVQANLLRRLADVETGAPRLGRFLVLARVGEGSHGVVYAAYDPKLDRRVALKRLHRGEGVGHRRVLREARALAQLSHPNVVTVFEVGEADGNAYVAMEFIEGTTLAEWLAETSRTVAETSAVLHSAGRGLANAHAHGLVHRDFKPSNVMVGADGRVRVTDFGLADYHHEPAASEPDGSVEASAPPTPRVASTIVGTPAYMAPELLEGAPADARSDQFAYCVTVVEALAGRRPFHGDTPEQLGESIRRGPSSELLHRLPRRLRRLVIVGLDPEPDRRHADLGVLVDALDRHTRRRSWVGWTVAAMALVAIPLSRGRGAHEDSGCESFAHALDDVWSPARREAIASSFAATGRPYAAHAETFVTTAVDRYARQWTEASVAACRASPPASIPTVRQICLERRKQELDGLLQELGAADEQLVGSSTSAVSSLVPVASCEHPDPSMDTSALEPGPRARLAEIDGELAHLWVLVLTGAYERAREGLAPLIVELEEIEHQPTLARALLYQGRAQATTGSYPEADAILVVALEAALAGGGDDTAALVASELADVRFRRGMYERAHDLVPVAAALHRRHTGEQTWPRLSNILGSGLVFGRRDTEAVDVFDQGIAAADDDRPEHAAALLSMRANRSAMLLRLGRDAEAERSLTEAEEYARVLLGEDHPQYTRLMILRAGMYSMRDDHETALRIQKRALEIWRRAVPRPSASEALMLTNVAEYLTRLERFDEALAALDEVRTVNVAQGTPQESWGPDLYTSMGSVESRRGNPRVAMEHHEHALELLHDAVEARDPLAGETVLLAAETALELDHARTDELIATGIEIYAGVTDPRMEGRFSLLRAVRNERRGHQDAARADANKALALLDETETDAWPQAQALLLRLGP